MLQNVLHIFTVDSYEYLWLPVLKLHELPSLPFPDPGRGGKEESHLPGSRAAFYERHHGSSLPCSRTDHHCQKLPPGLWDRGKMMVLSLLLFHILNLTTTKKCLSGMHTICRFVFVSLWLCLSFLQVIELCRPSDSRLEHVDFECLFSSLSLRLLLRVFASLLLERRVIFTADKLR